MITIVISSVNTDLLAKVKENIKNTIGTPFEILAYDNSRGERGICSVYNRGAREANFEIICFMHEDIEIKTVGWGEKIIELFSENVSLGLVGVAGGAYKHLSPSSWVVGDLLKDDNNYVNIIQSYKYKNFPSVHIYNNPKEEKLSRVACIDGVWFCSRKTICEQYSFDEELLKGFHGYDIDFSLSVNKNYIVAVTFEVLLEHYSEGKNDIHWIEACLKVQQKWKCYLPLNIAGFTKKEMKRYEKQMMEHFIRLLLDTKYTKSSVIKLIWDSKLYTTIGYITFLRLLYKCFKISVGG